MHKSTLIHLRIPFAIYLLPVLVFAYCQLEMVDSIDAIITFLILHLFLYPATHGYNSYFDKDKKSIGGVKNPPQVTIELYYVSLLFDFLAISLGFLISWRFSLMIFILGLESKAYSHPWIRLKKYSILSAIVTSIFQGGFIYIMSSLALQNLTFTKLLDKTYIYPALLCSFTFLGFYPITQIYQHDEDKERGDNTLSLRLGLNGTFIFSIFIFILSDIGYYSYFVEFINQKKFFIALQLFLLPLFVFFTIWYRKFIKDNTKANYRNTMLFQQIATICIVSFFITIKLLR